MKKNAKVTFYLGIAGILLVFLSSILFSILELLPPNINSLFLNYSSWLLLFAVLPGLGVISGFIALYVYFKYRRDAKKDGQPPRSRVFALTGLVTSIIAVLFGLYCEAFFIVLAIDLKPVPNDFVGTVELYTYSEDGFSIFPFRSMLLPDGNVVTLAQKKGFPSNGNDSGSLQIICTNQQCEKNWDMTFEENTGLATIDRSGNILLCTWSRDNEFEVGLYKLSSEGEILDSDKFELETKGSIIDVFETVDSNYIIVRSKKIVGPTNEYEYSYQKISPQGDVIWSFSDTRLSGGYIGNFIQTLDDNGNEGFLSVGTVGVFGDMKVRVIKLNQNGEMEWENSYTESGSELGKSILETDDGNFMVLGENQVEENSATERCVVLLKIDGAGNLIWRKPFAWASMSVLGFVPWENGGYLVAGRYVNYPGRISSTFGNNWDTFYMAIVSAEGDVIDRFHGEETRITLNMILSVNEENCILMGFGDRATKGNPDIPNNMRMVNYHK